MRINLRVYNRDGGHIRFTVFMNGANAGHLVLRKYEFAELVSLLQKGAERDIDWDFEVTE